MRMPDSVSQGDGHIHSQVSPISTKTTTTTTSATVTGATATTGANKTKREYDFTLYSHRGAPNGFKVACVLSELRLSYKTIFIDFKQGDHRKEEFIRICPNARIPALVDHGADDFAVWESGAILLYLVRTYDLHHEIWPDDSQAQSMITSWLMLQVSGHSVIQGQAFWFKFHASEYVPSAIKRYTEESRRIYSVLEFRLSEAREALWDKAELLDLQVDELMTTKRAVWLVGDSCTIADLSYLTWTRTAHRLEIDLAAEFPEVNAWVANMEQRPGVIQGLHSSLATTP